jgi:hypothetical protein
MVLSDDEIEESRLEDQRLAGQRKREAARERKRQKVFSQVAYQAIRTNDERLYAEQLRLANVTEGSEEWKRAWKYFREHSG